MTDALHLSSAMCGSATNHVIFFFFLSFFFVVECLLCSYPIMAALEMRPAVWFLGRSSRVNSDWMKVCQYGCVNYYYYY